MRSIVVGVDESTGAARALRWAAAERRVHDCSLTAVLCWNYLEQHQPEPGVPFDPEYGDEAARRTLDAIVERVLGEAAPHVARRTVNDHAARGLLESAEGADLLVLGARGLSGFRQVVLGSVSRQCLHHTTVPVAVVHEGPGERLDDHGRVVVGVDGSSTSQRALAWAFEEARRRQSPLTVVHAWTPPFVGGLIAPSLAFDTDAVEQAGHAVVDAALGAVDTAALRSPVERKVVCGPAGPMIVDAADRASLIVVGSRGRGGFKGLLLGSVSHHVTHHAGCPVVVIPHAT
jgi:nucleotide-binding universal stress UspA family protein